MKPGEGFLHFKISALLIFFAIVSSFKQAFSFLIKQSKKKAPLFKIECKLESNPDYVFWQLITCCHIFNEESSTEMKRLGANRHIHVMTLVLISMQRVVCQQQSLCKPWGCRRRQLAWPGVKSKHIWWNFITSLGDAMKEYSCFCPTGLWLRAKSTQDSSVRPQTRTESKHQVGDNALRGVTISPQRR